MFEPGFYVTAELRLKDASQVAAARQALAGLARRTLAEPGCSIFTVHHDTAVPTRFLLWERFEDEAAFKRHFEEAHTLAYLELELTEVVRHFVTDVLG